MAFSLENNISVKAQVAPEVFEEAIEKVDSLKYFTYVPAKSTTAVLPKITTSDGAFLQSDGRDCDWDPTESIVLDEKSVDLVPMKINLEVCGANLDSLMNIEAFNAKKYGEVSPTEEQLVLNFSKKVIAKEIDAMVWSQIVTEAASDSDFTNTVTGTTITSSNALDEVEKVVAAIPDAVYSNDDIKLFMSTGDYRKFRQALSGAATIQNALLPRYSVVDGRTFIDGVIEVVPCGIASGKMFAAAKNNIALASNILEDGTLDAGMGATPKDKNILYINGAFGAIASYVSSAEAVLYA